MAELVEGAGLENQKGFTPFGGSNPPLSANTKTQSMSLGFVVFCESVRDSKLLPAILRKSWQRVLNM